MPSEANIVPLQLGSKDSCPAYGGDAPDVIRLLSKRSASLQLLLPPHGHERWGKPTNIGQRSRARGNIEFTLAQAHGFRERKVFFIFWRSRIGQGRMVLNGQLALLCVEKRAEQSRAERGGRH